MENIVKTQRSRVVLVGRRIPKMDYNIPGFQEIPRGTRERNNVKHEESYFSVAPSMPFSIKHSSEGASCFAFKIDSASSPEGRRPVGILSN